MSTIVGIHLAGLSSGLENGRCQIHVKVRDEEVALMVVACLRDGKKEGVDVFGESNPLHALVIVLRVPLEMLRFGDHTPNDYLHEPSD